MEVIYDKKEQLDKIVAGLLPGEEIHAVLDMKSGGTGFLGITSQRIIVYDKAFLRKMKAVVSIPYSRADHRRGRRVASIDRSRLLLKQQAADYHESRRA